MYAELPGAPTMSVSREKLSWMKNSNGGLAFGPRFCANLCSRPAQMPFFAYATFYGISNLRIFNDLLASILTRASNPIISPTRTEHWPPPVDCARHRAEIAGSQSGVPENNPEPHPLQDP